MATILVESVEADPCTSPQASKVVGKAECIGLLGVDPQKAFGHPACSMYCNSGIGGEQAMINAATMIDAHVDRIHRLIFTGDDHKHFHIGCITWFINDKGDHPNPFTVIRSQDFDRGVWRCTLPEHQAWTSYYLREYEAQGKYHMVFPAHGEQNTISASFVDSLQAAAYKWETFHRRNMSIFRKGRNVRVEQLSAIQAEIIDPEDSQTSVNELLISELSQCHKIGAFGLARSHCLGFTLLHIFEARPDLLTRITLLTDATVDVKGCETQGEEIVSTLVKRGMSRSTTKEWLK